MKMAKKLLALVLTGVITYFGWGQIERLLTFPQHTTALRIPFLVPYLILPLGFGLMCLRLLQRIRGQMRVCGALDSLLGFAIAAAIISPWYLVDYLDPLPVLFGYLFLGAAFGIMLFKAGYNWVWAALISLLVYAGSGQFLLVSLISSGAGLATTALMTLFINTRHMFYGLSYIEKFKAGGWRYPFMIFTLTDETYSVNASILSVPDGVDEPRARFLIGELDHVYWIIGSVLGSLLSAALPMDFTGIDFSMTALFVVIFIDLIRNQKGRAGLIGALGLCAGILCLLIFGADKFLLPSLVLTVAVLSAGRPFFDPERRAAK